MSTAQLQTTVRSQIEAAFPFDVVKMPLHGPDNIPTPHYGLFRDDRTDVSACVPVAVKSGYVPHTKDDICALAESAIIGFDTAHDAKVRCRWNGYGHQVLIEPSRDYRRSVFGTDDNVYPRAIINAPFGRCFTASFGMYRDACYNLEMIRSVEECTFKIRHGAGLRDEMDELISDFADLSGNYDNVYDIACRLEQRRVAIKEFLAEMYPEPDDMTARMKKNAEKRTEKIIERMMRERDRVGRRDNDIKHGTLWECVNIVTGYVQHNKSRNNAKSLSGTDRALMAIEDDDTHKAWDLAMAMAS